MRRRNLAMQVVSDSNSSSDEGTARIVSSSSLYSRNTSAHKAALHKSNITSSNSEGEEIGKSLVKRKKANSKTKVDSSSQHSASSQRNSSQGSQSSQNSQSPLSAKELDRLASNVANLLLCADFKKVPVKRSDLSRVISKEYSRSMKEIIHKASNLLQEIYGYEIVELKNKSSYILANRLKTCLDDFSAPKMPEEAPVNVLLINILILIFMSHGEIQEATLEAFLGNLDIPYDKTQHHPFGKVHDLITKDFVQKGYLNITLNKMLDPPINMVTWGERAEREFARKDILNLACEIYGSDTRPEMWVNQWNEVVKEGQED